MRRSRTAHQNPRQRETNLRASNGGRVTALGARSAASSTCAQSAPTRPTPKHSAPRRTSGLSDYCQHKAAKRATCSRGSCESEDVDKQANVVCEVGMNGVRQVVQVIQNKKRRVIWSNVKKAVWPQEARAQVFASRGKRHAVVGLEPPGALVERRPLPRQARLVAPSLASAFSLSAPASLPMPFHASPASCLTGRAPSAAASLLASSSSLLALAGSSRPLSCYPLLPFPALCLSSSLSPSSSSSSTSSSSSSSSSSSLSSPSSSILSSHSILSSPSILSSHSPSILSPSILSSHPSSLLSPSILSFLLVSTLVDISLRILE
eukprot:g56512.t1